MAKWVTDGSEGLTIDGNTVTMASMNRRGSDNIGHALWQEGDGVSSQQHYWKINFPQLNPKAGVGLASKEHFTKGFACRGLFYMGDLSNGHKSERLVGEFGPILREGDDVGIFAVFQGNRLKMYVDVNGTNLGLAFDVPASNFKSVFPIVSFYNSGSAVCTKQTNVPSDTSRQPETYTGIEGHWKLTTLNNVRVAINITTSRIELVEPERYKWVVNRRIRTTMTNVNGLWSSNGVISKVRTVNLESSTEQPIKHLMDGVTAVEIDDNGKLLASSNTVSSEWVRFDGTPKPFVGEAPFA